MTSGIKRSTVRHLFLFIGPPLAMLLLSFVVGRYPIPLGTVFKIMAAQFLPLEQDWPATLEAVVLQIRMPRIFGAFLVGASLSASGAAFQGIFRNPLVSPYILGVAAGAGFGASLAILLSYGTIMLHLSALAFGLLAVLAVFAISQSRDKTPTLVLVLSGVVVGAFFSALTSIVKYVADPFEKLPTIIFWLMGSLGRVTPEIIAVAAPLTASALLALGAMRWRINVLSLGEEEALALGIDVRKERGTVIFLCTILTASAVCLSGIVGWVGLVIPHLARMTVGPDFRKLFPASISMGAFYVLAIDNLARTLSQGEIPLGILTALIGAPFFAWLLTKNRVGW